MDVVEKYIKEQSVCIENLTKAIEGLSKNER